DKMNSVIQEDIAGARVVKAFVQEDKEAERFQKHNKDLSDTQFKVLILMAYMAPVMNIVLNLAVVGIIYIGGIQVQAGAMAPGKVMAAITYISQILNGMMMLAMIFQTISRGTTSAKRINEVLKSEPAIRDGKGAEGQIAADPANAIEFKNVSFTYPGSKANVLHDINLRIKKGEMLAVIGATGCGKSTFVNMIDRFYDATSGEVLIDGVPIRDYKLDKLRDKIAFVLQKSELFSTTIRENIMIGKPGATEDELKEAARAAQADDFIMQQPEGYDTAVAQSGMSLSGGQKQRIAISRALIKDSDILVMDDSTSALDLKTEAALHKALREKFAGITKVIVAQRIATVKNADRIAVIDGGTIIACAPHDELMKTCSVYRDIYDSQLKRGGAANG
ncbi:MAG: ABC transporter ATP-binding protein, partial [Lachnospiraceae bacterium]|nr:ABC transporter ATP-binding protein [Lachnospiraceae bacterium]